MSVKLILLLWLATLRLALTPGSGTTPQPAVAWRWHLGVKHDSYGYTLAVYQDAPSRFALRLHRSIGSSVDLTTTATLGQAIRAAQLLYREYGKASRMADPRDMRATADIAV